MTPQAQKALDAALLKPKIGPFAARRMAEKAGVSSLYRLACQLIAEQPHTQKGE